MTTATAEEHEILADAAELHADGAAFAKLEQTLGWELARRLVTALSSDRAPDGSCRP